MRIAVCDDDREELRRVMDRIAAYREQRQIDLRCQGFDSAVELLDAVEREPFDLLLLDVMMPGLSGIQAAREIRRTNEQVRIVFQTSSPDYAVESYAVQASNYLLKPATPERLFPILDKLVRDLQQPEEVLPIRSQGCVFALPYSKIEYVEVLAKTLYFHLADGSVRELRGRLADYEPALLARPGFHKVHRSYLVNFRWVAEVRQGELVTFGGRRLPIARTAYAQVRAAYVDYLFDTGLQKGGDPL